MLPYLALGAIRQTHNFRFEIRAMLFTMRPMANANAK
jgi:hypothetical protein